MRSKTISKPVRWRLFGPLDARLPLGGGHYNGAEVGWQDGMAECITICMQGRHGEHVQIVFVQSQLGQVIAAKFCWRIEMP